MQRGTGLYRMCPAHGMTTWLKSNQLSTPAKRLNGAHFHQRACAKARGLSRMQSLPTGCSTMLLYLPSGNPCTGLLRPLSSMFWFLAVFWVLLISTGHMVESISFLFTTTGLQENWRISETSRKCDPKVVSLCLLGLIFDGRFSLPWLLLH